MVSGTRKRSYLLVEGETKGRAGTVCVPLYIPF